MAKLTRAVAAKRLLALHRKDVDVFYPHFLNPDHRSSRLLPVVSLSELEKRFQLCAVVAKDVRAPQEQAALDFYHRKNPPVAGYDIGFWSPEKALSLVAAEESEISESAQFAAEAGAMHRLRLILKSWKSAKWPSSKNSTIMEGAAVWLYADWLASMYGIVDPDGLFKSVTAWPNAHFAHLLDAMANDAILRRDGMGEVPSDVYKTVRDRVIPALADDHDVGIPPWSKHSNGHGLIDATPESPREKLNAARRWFRDAAESIRLRAGVNADSQADSEEQKEDTEVVRGFSDFTPRDESALHTEDFTSITWFGIGYSFTKSQAPIIKILWEVWEESEGCLAQETIGQKLFPEDDGIGDRFRLRDKFRNHVAWGILIQEFRKGTYGLVRPPKKAPTNYPRITHQLPTYDPLSCGSFPHGKERPSRK